MPFPLVAASGNSVGYDANSYGIVFGAEKQNDRDNNWVYGFHGAASGQSVTVKSPETASGKTSAFNLGIQARYGAENPEGVYLFGNSRFGIEDSHLDRRLHVESYNASHSASWTGLSGSLMGGGGYRWALNDNVSAGPVTALNYTTLHRPSVTEQGDDGSRLRLGVKNFNSLQSSLGVNGNVNMPLASGEELAARAQLTWDHELLDDDVAQQASFAHYRSIGFSARNQVSGRDAMGVKAGVSYKINADVELGAEVESEVFRSGYDSIAGNLSAN
ncbi:MAG: autotransporter outer membrane beta-barrel domain-containing protein [Kluyvera sp.]